MVRTFNSIILLVAVLLVSIFLQLRGSKTTAAPGNQFIDRYKELGVQQVQLMGYSILHSVSQLIRQATRMYLTLRITVFKNSKKTVPSSELGVLLVL
jgi:hypothetical protein